MTNNEGEVILCPCDHFSSILDLRHALESAESVERLLQWLSGSLNIQALKEKKRLSCGSHCRRRVKASFALLNGIRDACRPYLEAAKNESIASTATSDNTPKKKRDSVVSYDEAFPSLGAAERKPNTKPKRRIRPALVTQTKTSSTAWNLVNLPAENNDDPSFPAAATSHSRPVASIRSAASGPEKLALAVAVTPKKKVAPSPVVNNSSPTAPVAATTPTPKATGKKPAASSVELKRLVVVYCALINHCLVPSSALELHLLIRLLTVSAKPIASTTTENTAIPLASIFSSSESCVDFAATALRKLSTLLKGLPLLFNDLVQCPPFRQHLPDLTEEFTKLLHENNASSFHHQGSGVSISVDQTALLTLPFNKERDSRHNYRTREEQAMYKNREESRDAFLYQLRAFLSARGTVVDTAQSNRAMQKVRQSSRLVVSGLLDSNQSWFAEFFCDLLLQIGHVPIQETDKDLLKIIDKDKLQKLHRRFSSKTTRTDRSTKTLVADPKLETNGSPPAVAAQQLFPGHQEFFYLFVMSADSYKFTMHLRARLVVVIRDCVRNVGIQDIGKKVMDLRLVARFLGVILFSPNWRSSREKESNLPSASPGASLDGLHQLDASGLSVIDCVNGAIVDRSLVVSIPWIVELLRPSQWDAQIGHSQLYWKLLSTLRQIQLECFQSGKGLAEPSSPNKVLLGQYLEPLFGETVGLSQTMKLLPCDLSFDAEKPTADPRFLDDSVEHSTITVSASNAHLEELAALVSILSKKDALPLRSPGASRKLRPSVVSPTISSLQTPTISPSPSMPMNDSSDTLSGVALNSTHFGSFQSRLRDSFFHQHGDLRNLCEFATSQALRNIGSELAKQYIQPLLPQNLSSEDQLSEIRLEALRSCSSFLKSSLEVQISGTISVLGPPYLECAVKNVAIALAVNHGERVGEQMVVSVVDSEMEKARASLIRVNRKRLLFDKEPPAASLDPNSASVDIESGQRQHPVDAVTSVILAAASSLASISERFEEILTSLRFLNSKLDELAQDDDSTIPPEKTLRPFFESVLLLDDYTDAVVQWVLSESSAPLSKRWDLIATYSQTAVEVSRLSRYGLRNFSSCLSNMTVVEQLLQLGARSGDRLSVSGVFTLLVEARLVKQSDLTQVLRAARRDDDNNECLQHLVELLDKDSTSI